MAKFICALIIAFSLLWTTPAAAGDNKINVSLLRQDDGMLIGELWYNDRVLWRLRLTGDGAQPVAGTPETRTTVVVPDIDDGFFTLKIYNR